jgi:hypothetical protein
MPQRCFWRFLAAGAAVCPHADRGGCSNPDSARPLEKNREKTAETHAPQGDPYC